MEHDRLLRLLAMSQWRRGLVAVVAAMVACSNPGHGVTLESTPKATLDKTCVAEALGPFRPSLDEKFSGPRKEIYSLVGREQPLKVVVLHADGDVAETFRLAWVQLDEPTVAQVVAVRKSMETVYNRVREKCSTLPPFVEARETCWRSGCRPQS